MDQLIPRASSLNFNPRALFNTPDMRVRRAAFRNSPYGGRYRNTLSARTARARRGRTRLQYRRRNPTSVGILGGTNADTRLIYRKKRMPKRKRRLWAKFVRKVNAVDERELGSRTVLFNNKIQNYYTDDALQGCQTLALYSFVNTTNQWLNDMNQIGQLENEANPTAAAGATIDRNSKVMFHSAVMDVTIRNTSRITLNPVGPVLGDAPEAAIEMDVYEIWHRKEATDGANAILSMTAMLNQWDEPEIGGAGTGIAIQDRGATPWEQTSALGRLGIKIAKKTKYFIPNGQTITFQVRDPKRRQIHYGDLERNEGYVRPGWTKTYYLIYKLVPGLTAGVDVAGRYRAQIDIGYTRKYMYKVEGFNEPRERLLTGSYTPIGPV